jgi:hypothetical protein
LAVGDLKVYNQAWRNCGPTARGYVCLIEKEKKLQQKDGRNNLKSVQSNQGFVRNVTIEKCNMKQTPTKPAKSTNNDNDNDEEDSCTECCWLFQHDLGQVIEMDDKICMMTTRLACN